MESKCNLKYQRYSYRKVKQVLDKIRGKSLSEAENALAFIPKRTTEVVRKAMRSAGANLAVKMGKKVDLNNAWVKEAYSTKGPMTYLRRFHAGPQGRAMPYKKKMCHLTVVVSDSKEVDGE